MALPKKLKSLIENYCMGITPSDSQMDEIFALSDELNADPAEVSAYMQEMMDGPTKEERVAKEKEERKKAEAKRKASQIKVCKEKEIARKAEESRQNANVTFVDLGLSVKWATCNLGASKPEEFGDYFAWGETSPKKEYSWKEYKFGKEEPFSKYQPKKKVLVRHLFRANEYVIKGDDKTELDEIDDAATVLLGKNWRMPTITEFEELLHNCNWKTAYMNGVQGFKVRSLVPGYTHNWIFLPDCGFNIDKNEVRSGISASSTSYATSSLDKNDPIFAMDLSIIVNWGYPDRILNGCELHISHSIRSSGNAIRPVCK